MEFHQIIESFVQDSVNLRDQGNKFERLCVQILKIAPEFKDRFDEVLLWRDFNNRYGIKQGDDGIDIMARDTQGRWYSVQCKCIHQTSKLDLPMLKNFLGKNTIAKASGELFCEVYQKLIFHTAREITDKVANALRDTRTSESLEARAYGYDWLLDSGIDWSSLDESNLESLKPQAKKQLRAHQKEAFEKIHSHFVEQGNARGKVIMACGTGKSLLSIRVIDSLVDSGEMALVLAPSLALLNQLIDEFRKESLSEHFELFAVCSDTRVGSKKDTSSEDLDLQELRIPPTTDHLALSRAISHTLAACPPPQLESKPKIIIFSTYQSLQVIIDAKLPPFKLILNDEAHRTAGVQKITPQGEVRDIGIWQKTHDNDLLPATYRLYLTATPRVYGPKAKERLQKTKKEKNLDEDLMLFSMDDEKLFGSEIYRLDFADAIEQGLLSDFRVIISYVSEEFAAKYLATLTKEQNNSNLNVIDAGKMVAFANAINKRHLTYVDEQGRFEACSDDGKPMKRAVVFHSSIRDSKFTTKCFAQGLISRSIDFTHIDGADNAYEKASKLSWLKESSENTRVLSNAKCLTEGIDVPNLDAVCFFLQAGSVVDVVQAVGRAIRKADSKKYGYIILPLVLTEQEIAEYDKTLKGDKFKLVWQVLTALRSHDERLIDEARINEILQLERELEEKEVPEATLFTIDDLFKEMKNAVPKNLGDLQYWENYASKVGDIMQALILRIQALLDSSPAIQKLFSTFCKSLQGNLNASFNESEAIALVAQHIITKPIFECIFPSLDFTTFDKVSAELEKLHTKLLEQGLNAETKTLEKFYTSVRQSAEYAKSDKSKQSLIKNLYDTLFKQAFKKTQEKLGIVYTPIEGVDFIIHSTQYLLQKHFGKSLGDEHIHIADPFVGTGTFITRLIQSGYLDSRLESKFAKELWANEITLLGYYIAQINIATTYHERLTKLNGDSVGDSAFGLESRISSPHLCDSHSRLISARGSKSHDSSSKILESQGGDILNDSAKDSRICDEKSGLCEATQGRALGVRNRSGDEAIADLSRKAESTSKKPTPEIKLFDNLLFTDTFNTYAPDSKGFIGSKDGTQTTIDSLPYLEKNYAKIQEFKNTEFKIFLTNPPYSTGQKSANDDNKNTSYPFMDQRIADTYAKLSTATNKGSNYDSYKMSIRFMSDRIGESGGIIGFITNGSFIESNSDDGLRACLADEFDYIYIINLRGNIAKTKQDKNSGEGQNFFGNASSTPVAICFFVKLDSSQATPSLRGDTIAEAIHKSTQVDSSAKMDCHALPSDKARNDRKATIYYYDIGDNLSTQQKRNIIANLHSIQSLESQGLFTLITPNKDYDWINQRDYSFMAFMPIANTDTKLKALPLQKVTAKLDPEVLQKGYVDIFEIYSAGIKSNRDKWVNHFSKAQLESNMTRMIDNYNVEVEKHKADSTYKPTMDSTKINWSHKIFETFKKSKLLDFDENGLIVESIYRPFCKAHLYMSSILNERLYQMPQLFPTPRTQEIAILDCEAGFSKSARDFYATHHYLPNRAICISTDNRSPFSALMTSFIPDLSFTAGSQCFPLYYYERVESNAENGQMTMDYDLAESMDCHATATALARNDGKTDTLSPSSRADEIGVAIHKNTQMDSSMDCHADKSARNDKNTAYYRRKDAIRDEALAFFQAAYAKANAQKADSSDNAQNLNDSQAAGFCDDFVGCQGGGEGIYLSGNEQALAADSRKSAQKPTPKTITKEDMFYYIYAILNHPTYIAKYKDNLSKMLPRIPLMQDFLGFVASGRALAQLHLEYESFCDVESMSVACGAFACLKGDRDTASKDQGSLFEQESREKARQDIAQLGDGDFTLIKPIHFLAKGYKHTIIFNDKLSIVNIPAAAHRYQVNGKSAIEWILDRYKISTDKASGIVNDPNLYESTSGALRGLKGGRYVCALLLSAIEMSVRTSKILESMPEYKLLESST